VEGVDAAQSIFICYFFIMRYPSDALPLPDVITDETARLFKINAERMAGQPDLTMIPPAEGRALGARNDEFWNSPVLPVDQVEEMTLGGVRVRRYAHGSHKGVRGVLLFIHGGGWAYGSIDTHDVATRALARATGFEVFSVDYRRTPEHAWPAPLDDAFAVYRALLDAGVESSRIVLAGDSAGAQLALALMLRAQTQDLAQPAGASLLYGVYDDDDATPAHLRFGPGGYGLTTLRMRNYWNWAVPVPDRESALVRPVRHASDAQLRALPPLHLTSAGLDCLKSDTLRLIDRLRAAGHTAHTHDEVLAVPHGHFLAYHHLKATRDLVEICATKLRRFVSDGTLGLTA
jgi:acetyl esterase